jgi:CSLREA domain-containing protein
MRGAINRHSRRRQSVADRSFGRQIIACTLSIACGTALIVSAGRAAIAASAAAVSSTTYHASTWRLPALPARPFAVQPQRVFTVNTTADADNAIASNIAHICKTAAGKCTLRAAIDAADDDTKADKIVVPAGTYTLTSLGPLKPDSSMLIVGAGGRKTFIDGANTYQIFDINSTIGAAVEIDDMTLRHGSSDQGGALSADGAEVTLGFDIFTHNAATTAGGAVYVANASLWMNNSIVSANTAKYGGGVDIEAGGVQLSDDTIGGSQASDGNQASSVGGGVENDDGTTSVANTNIDFNSAGGYGGGVDSDSPLSMQGGSISHNSASTSLVGHGGGISLAFSAQFDGVHIDDNSIHSASMGGIGAGIFSDGQATFVNCTADGNAILDSGTGSTDQGGGVANLATMLWIAGSISGNKIVPSGSSAGLIGQGGGVYDNSSTTINGASIKNNSVTGQTSISAVANEYLAAGGGIYDAGSLHLSHDTIDGNSLASYDASGAGVYSDTPDTTGAVSLDVGNNSARATDQVTGGGIFADESFVLANSSIHDQSNTVTEAKGGSIEGGAAIINQDGVLDNVVIKGVTNTNRSTSGLPVIKYGALYIGANAHLNDVAVSNINSTVPDAGEILDTIFMGGSAEWNAVSITGVTNLAGTPGAPGGAIDAGVIDLNGAASLDTTIIQNVHNTALGGAGAIESGVEQGFQVNSHNFKVINVTNLATGSKGEVDAGAVEADQNSTFVNLEVDGVSNTAGRNGSVQGGALYLGDTATVDEADISNTVSKTLGDQSNSSLSFVDGGAVFEDGVLNMTNDTLTGDRAISAGTTTNGGNGGALYVNGPVTLTNVTMNRDTASSAGGALYSNNPVKEAIAFKNTIVASSPSPQGNCASSHAPPPFLSGGHNLGSDASCKFNGIGDQEALPKLAPLRNNGGFVLTEAELKGSRSINAGDNNGCPATDARGVSRPQGGTCDIGAYELKPTK